MNKNQQKICNWCGKEAVVFYQKEMLCDNCWKYIKLEKLAINNRQFQNSSSYNVCI